MDYWRARPGRLAQQRCSKTPSTGLPKQALDLSQNPWSSGSRRRVSAPPPLLPMKAPSVRELRLDWMPLRPASFIGCVPSVQWG